MKIEQEPVTGREEKERLTPQMRALSEFYQALNGRDMELVARNWAQTDEAVMDNPLGGIRRGWEEIRTVYERLFRSSGEYWFEFYDYSYHEAGEIFYVVGRERGEFRIGDVVLNMAIRTSRVFRRADGAWRQVHHHGSIDDPDLLARYQQAVRGQA
ncbi:MAG TPA: nuclear transport factor 2 family protein [Desulfuromonadaceae bacterium]